MWFSQRVWTTFVTRIDLATLAKLEMSLVSVDVDFGAELAESVQ